MKRFSLLLIPILVGGFLYWLLAEPPTEIDDPSSPSSQTSISSTAITTMSDGDRFSRHVLANLAILPGASYPATLSWASMFQIGQEGTASLENLLRTRPLDFLPMSLNRYERTIPAYRAIFLKRERIEGQLYPNATEYEKLLVHIREQPLSIHMTWLEHAKLAHKVLYVAGENGGKILARPTGRILGSFIVSREIDGEDARQSGRYTIAEVGVHFATKQSFESMTKAQANGTLHLSYQGIETPPELGRPCYKLVRTPYNPTEEDGINEWTGYYDCETWLQVGTVLKDAQGQLIGAYFFRDLQINPEVNPKQFQRSSL